MNYDLMLQHSRMVTLLYEAVGSVLSLSVLVEADYVTADMRADYELMLVRARDTVDNYISFCERYGLTLVTIPAI